MTNKTIAKHISKLKSAARSNKGVLPSRTRLAKMGLFGSYDAVRIAGKLGSFKRAYRNR